MYYYWLDKLGFELDECNSGLIITVLLINYLFFEESRSYSLNDFQVGTLFKLDLKGDLTFEPLGFSTLYGYI